MVKVTLEFDNTDEAIKALQATNGATITATPTEATPAEPAATTKRRKRRTKAEIEADKAKAQQLASEDPFANQTEVPSNGSDAPAEDLADKARQLLVDACAANRESVFAMLKNHGVEKLSDASAEQLPTLCEELQGIINAAALPL